MLAATASPPRAGSTGRCTSSAAACPASSGRSLLRPVIAVPNILLSATARNDDAAYGRSFTYCESAKPFPRGFPRRPRTSSTGSISTISAAVHRSSVASGYTTRAIPNDSSRSWTRAGFLCSRNPRSVAGATVDEIVTNMPPLGIQDRRPANDDFGAKRAFGDLEISESI